MIKDRRLIAKRNMFPTSPFLPLPLPNSTKWLVSASTSPKGYDIFLTDTTTIYRETLAEQEIIERAEVNPTHSIVWR